MYDALRDVKKFYFNNKKIIEYNYPGINQNRLVEFYLEVIENDIKDWEKQLLNGVPLEYIIGVAYFYKSEFRVNENVLIPRFETELLVEYALDDLKKLGKDRLRVLDIGTGCGAIGISILKELTGTVELVATDISEDALNVAKRNYYHMRFSISKSHKFIPCLTDRLDGISGKFDLIVSNPPYIKRSRDMATVHHNVNKYEPDLALFIDDDQYDDWFISLFKQVRQRVSEKGTFIMEGHEAHLDHLLKYAKDLGFIGKVVQDLTRRDRFLKLQRG